MSSRATILHADLDAFYVSMELLRRPELRGLPVVVGGLGPRGVVSTCSYEARRFGVRSAMPMARARQLCPQAVYLPPDFTLYIPASRAFHAILSDFTPLVDSAGADEAYLDVAGSEALFGDPVTIATAIRKRVRAEIGIAVSIGVAANRLVAKVASDAAKPDGLLVVAPGEEASFLAPRPLRELPMVGPKTAAALQTLGVRTIGDLAAIPLATLEAKFGSHGAELHRRSLGMGDAHAGRDPGRARSVSREMTFGVDESSADVLHAALASQADRLAASLAQESIAARTVSLKLRFPPFETTNRSATPGAPVILARDIYQVARGLFDDLWDRSGRRPVRLVGIGLSGIVQRSHQLRLGEDDRALRLDEALSGIRERYGSGAMRHGIELAGRRDGPFDLR